MNVVKRHQKQFHKGKAGAERREILACLLLVCRHLYAQIPPQRRLFVNILSPAANGIIFIQKYLHSRCCLPSEEVKTHCP